VPRLLGLDVGVDRVRDRRVGALGLVLVDHRGPLAVVSHPSHQVPEPGAAVGGELVPGVAQVVEVQTQGWFTLLRLFGPLQPWFDKTWRPGEIEKID
jgi:hypothetical protein